MAAGAPKPPTIRPARARDVALLLELFGELAEYEHLEHELRATEEQLGEALFGPRPAAEAPLIGPLERSTGRRKSAGSLLDWPTNPGWAAPS